MAIDFSDRLAVKPDVLLQMMGDEAVVLSMSTEQYVGFDCVAAHMWHVLRTAGTIEAGVAQLANDYDIDLDTLRQDVARFVEQLVDHGLATTERLG